MSNRQRIDEYIGSLGELRGKQPVLAEIARSLADELDANVVMSAASVAKELRATLDQLAEESPDEQDNWLTTLAQPVPPTFRDTEKPGSGVARPTRGRGSKAVGKAVDAVATARGGRRVRDRP